MGGIRSCSTLSILSTGWSSSHCRGKERSSGICFRCRFLMTTATRCSIYNFHFSQSGPSLGMHCLTHLAWVSLVDSHANVLTCWLSQARATDLSVLYRLHKYVLLEFGGGRGTWNQVFPSERF